jgi:hypothetical protein
MESSKASKPAGRKRGRNQGERGDRGDRTFQKMQERVKLLESQLQNNAEGKGKPESEPDPGGHDLATLMAGDNPDESDQWRVGDNGLNGDIMGNPSHKASKYNPDTPPKPKPNVGNQPPAHSPPRKNGQTEHGLAMSEHVRLSKVLQSGNTSLQEALKRLTHAVGSGDVPLYQTASHTDNRLKCLANALETDVSIMKTGNNRMITRVENLDSKVSRLNSGIVETLTRIETTLKSNDMRVMTLCGRLSHKLDKMLHEDIGGKLGQLLEAELTARAAKAAAEMGNAPEYANCGCCPPGTMVCGADLSAGEFSNLDSDSDEADEDAQPSGRSGRHPRRAEPR